MHAKRHSFPGFEAALSRFQAEYPDYSKTAILGSLRARYYRYLDAEDVVYLDYASGGLCTPALHIGEDQIRRIGSEMIKQRVLILTSWLRKALLTLQHDNAHPLVQWLNSGEQQLQNIALVMKFLDAERRPFDMIRIGQLAAASKICVRTFAFNPMSEDTSRETTAARVSLGLVSNFNDVYRFYEFARRFVNVRAGAI
jgi:hypothetical protein